MINKAEFTMMDDFYAVGFVFPGPVGAFDAMANCAFWMGQDKSCLEREDYKKLVSEGCGQLGTWVRFSNKGEQNFYFFGTMVADKDNVPQGMVAVKFPGSVYAAFEADVNEDYEQFRPQMEQAWKTEILPWIANSVVRPDRKGRCFEMYYGDKVTVYMPVESKSNK